MDLQRSLNTTANDLCAFILEITQNKKLNIGKYGFVICVTMSLRAQNENKKGQKKTTNCCFDKHCFY